MCTARAHTPFIRDSRMKEKENYSMYTARDTHSDSLANTHTIHEKKIYVATHTTEEKNINSNMLILNMIKTI